MVWQVDMSGGRKRLSLVSGLNNRGFRIEQPDQNQENRETSGLEIWCGRKQAKSDDLSPLWYSK